MEWRQKLNSGYLMTKAERFLKVGVDIYRKSDALAQPEESLSSSRIKIITEAAQQLVEGKGFAETTPLSEIGVEGFYDVVKTFHFEVCGQETMPTDEKDKILDRMVCRHIMTSEEVTLFNLVDAPLPQHKPFASGRNP